MNETPRKISPAGAGSAWWLVLCLIGLDYFSTLAYLPSLAVAAVGPLAPLAAAAVAIVTLGAALPVYAYVAGRSPHGRGATGLLERQVPGWKGKLAVLLLLSFVATDYVVTQNLSIADAAEHVRANPVFSVQVNSWLDRHWHPETWFVSPWWHRLIRLVDRQLAVALILSAATLASWAWWRRGSPQTFLRVAAAVVISYLLMNAIVLVSALAYIAGDGWPLWLEWRSDARLSLQTESGVLGMQAGWTALQLALVSFPYVALGLSGFELSMAVTPLVQGAVDDVAETPRGRIRNMRKLLVAAASITSLSLLVAVLAVTVLVPQGACSDGGPAMHRALAYLAHGGALANGRPASAINGLFGPAFGTAYDAVTILILCLAGACVTIALRDYVPEFMQRLGMEVTWAHKLGVKLRFFNVVVLVVVVAFRAKLAALQWVYVTSVLVLLAGGALAALADVRKRIVAGWLRLSLAMPFTLAVVFFACMALLTVTISRSGLEIAAAFAVGILATSLVSRWIRSTELRFDGFEFADGESRQRWEQCCAHDFQVLVPHRPGLHSRAEKVNTIRQRHRLAADVPVIVIEASLGDPSDFLHRPLMQVRRIDGFDLIQVARCVSIAHVLAAIGLEMSQAGRPAEFHFGWSDESPMAANLSFLLFGEGNIPWMVRELLRASSLPAGRRPAVVIG